MPEAIVGLCGYAGVGKDAAARGLLKNGWTRVSFADAVRDLALKINPYIDRDRGDCCYLNHLIHIYGWDGAKKESEVRNFLQRLGTGAREVLGEHVWVAAAVIKIDDARAGGVVVTDCRFPNEVAMLRAEGARVVRITRPGVGPVNGHISETAIDDIEPDHVIANDGTEEELQAKLVAYAESLEAQAV